ncbi:Ribosomal RNA small subunit methyltransferase I [Thalassovita mediterranea]|uniref:Ribosomal RNA small subunit methyltransferase I n=1 Tax=Thalassovita mediterranea TaxID=340021 RepID=A0A0N7M1D4_9RHOB|nr:16S rRNA (cytidine(1402)-2'-O)-methyltransferase [Thalassovita mediterranea]CUH82995.1 Ribosomal RNA small subunit methyltransferase I [Thalassovita mediterranea]SIS31278.1 16S rRNA (cytidine1402-2'-O)-methyltransferase [Thalassovita mediterranea]
MLNLQAKKLSPGVYLLATPIGTARDITLRALDILASADVLVAEDTRSLRKLMDIHGIALGERPLLSYHDHNGAQMRPRLLGFLAEGKSLAYASEAGTPMVADPGFDLARAARDAGHEVVSAPGPSAVVTALTLAGLPTDRFMFAGFLPNAKGARRKMLEELRDVPATLAFYESPKRIAAMLADAVEVMGADRDAAVCRELTKKFEEVLRGTLADLATTCAERTLKGEIVVVIDRARSPNINEVDLEAELKTLLDDMSVRDASDMLAERTGVKRRKIYQMALALSQDS